MRLLIDIFHPSNVHFLKNFMWKMQEKGHEILVASKDKDVSLALLQHYGFPYKKTGRYSKNLLLKVLQMLKIDYDLYKIARQFKPDILLGQGAINAAHVSKLIRRPCIVFADDEYSLFLYRWFADVIITLGSFDKDIGKKQIKIKTLKEMTYLHPNYFTPDPTVLDEIQIEAHERFSLIRFVAWEASHDFGKAGFNLQSQMRLVKELEKHNRVFISAEGKLPPDLEGYRLNVSPDRIHQVLYYAYLFVGDGQTMAIESAVLGTPAIRCNTFVGSNDMAQFIELERKYGLTFSFKDPDMAIQKAVELLSRQDMKNEWREKSLRLLHDKSDITEFMVSFVENYPASFYAYKAKSVSINS